MTDDVANAETLPGSGDPAEGASAPLVPGTVLLERYRVERWLGSGGMGAVYAALDLRLDQPVALKFVAGARSELERERLRAEVRTLQGLTHLGIARTYTYDEAAGEPFIVMELLTGETLAARIARGPLPEAEVRAMLVAVAAALGEAHRAGVVHRDVKPANVMMCADGRVVLMDFGLARNDDAPAPRGESRSLLMTTSLKGTPAYLAPEMAQGRRVDARADLYSLGVMAHESLAGVLPFTAATATAMIAQHVDAVPPDVRARNPDVSASLAALIARLLAKDPDARPATAGDVLVALAPPRRPRRWPWLLAAGCFVSGVVIAAGLVLPRSHPGAGRARDAGGIAALSDDERAAVIAIYDEGTAAYNRGDYARATELYLQAYDRYPVPAFEYNIAQAYRQIGNATQAIYFYRQYLRANPAVAPEDRQRIEALVEDLEATGARAP